MVKYILTPSTYSIISSNLVSPLYTGIGTSNPQYTVDVLGNTNINGTLYVNNTIFTGGGGVSANSNEVWIQNGTAIYYNNGSVGIGSSSPISTLDLNPLRIYATSNITRIAFNTTSLIESTGSNLLRFAHSSGLTSSIEFADTQTVFNVGTERMRYTSNGSLGIGTSIPLQTLHLEDGVAYFSSNLLIGASNSDYRVHITTSNTTPYQDRSLWIENRNNGDVGFVFKNASISPNTWSIGVSSNNTRLDFVYSSSYIASNTVMTIQKGGRVGVGTLTPNYTLDSQLFSSQTSNDTIVGDTLYTNGTLLLGANLSPVPKALYLPLNSSNVAFITQYITYTYSALRNSWWSAGTLQYLQRPYVTTSDFYYGSTLVPDGRVVLAPWLFSGNVGVFNPLTNVFSTYPATGAGFFAYAGAVTVPDGRVIFIPNGSATIGVFNPTTNVFSTIPITAPPYSTGSGNGYFAGGVLVPDGRVVFAPDATACVGIFNPITNTFSTVPFTDPGRGFLYQGAILTPNGRVVFAPNNSDQIGIFDPTTNTYSTTGSLFAGQNAKYVGGVLLQDGRVLFIPNNPTASGQLKATYYNAMTNTITFGNTLAVVAGYYNGGVVLSDGRVLFVPANITTFDIFDPLVGDITVSLSGAPGTSAFRGGTLLPDGRVFLTPLRSSGGTYFYGLLSGFPQPPSEFCFHPFFNKF